MVKHELVINETDREGAIVYAGTGTDLDAGRQRCNLSGTRTLQRSEKGPACAVSGKRDKGIIQLLERAHMWWSMNPPRE